MAAQTTAAYTATTSADALISNGFLTFSSPTVAAGFKVGALAWVVDASNANPALVRVQSVSGANVGVAFQSWGGAGQGYLPKATGGTIFKTGGIGFQGNYGNSNLSKSGSVAYTGLVGGTPAYFQAGETVTATSGGTAIVAVNSGTAATGTLQLVAISGTFADTDTLTGSISGTTATESGSVVDAGLINYAAGSKLYQYPNQVVPK